MEKKKLSKLKHKYLLIIRDDATLEKKFSFNLTKLNVFIAVGFLIIFLIFITIYIIAFTPLREYIPGYSNVNMDRKLRELTLKSDSLEKSLLAKDDYLRNIRNIILGKDEIDSVSQKPPQTRNYKNIANKKSRNDSLLRVEVENMEKNSSEQLTVSSQQSTEYNSIRNYFFFTPLKGIVTNSFNASSGHFGIDIVAKKNEPIKSTLDGTVILADWTIKTGYVIAIQHEGNLISVYKHNSTLMKKEGDYVKAGQVIAIIGTSGELSTGPHLHFELWYNSKPINPRDYIKF